MKVLGEVGTTVNVQPDAGTPYRTAGDPHAASGPGSGKCRVIVGVDDTPAGIAALRRGLELAAVAKAPLVAVGAWDIGLPRHGGQRRHHRGRSHVVLYLRPDLPRCQAAALVRKALRAAARGCPRVPVAIMASQGEPGAVLTELAGSNDVLVVGADQGLCLRHAAHGSVSSYCRRHARCPVMTVRAAEQAVSDAR
jgi:nucleotide-binding universal stress UspA family protein